MAVGTSSQQHRVAGATGVGIGPGSVSAHVRPRRVWLRRLLVVLSLMAVLLVSAWAVVRFALARAPSARRDMETAQVRRGELALILKEQGNLESAVNIDIKCEMTGGSVILWIVEDGSQVRQGDTLVELDASDLEENLNQQRITFEKARAAMIQAEKDFAAAQTAVDEYLEGTYVQELLAAESQITIASENLRSSQNALEHSERMFRKGYISALDLASQTFSVERARLELASARTAKDVLERFTKEKVLQELTSKRDADEALVAAQQASFDLEESRLRRLEAEVPKAVITAPADGMVVFANESDRRGTAQQAQIETGAAVRERQTILRLPDLAQMQVKVNIHESSVDALGRALRSAQAANRELPVRMEVQGQQLRGRLVSIANQPVPPDWRMGNIKQYPCIVSIDGAPEGLRPGMTARCEMLVDKKTDVLMIPIAAVLEQRDGHACWVTTPEGVERRSLVLGMANEQVVEVVDGVSENETVVLNPRATIPEARIVDRQPGVSTAERLIAPPAES